VPELERFFPAPRTPRATTGGWARSLARSCALPWASPWVRGA